VGQWVACRIYEQRPTPCREVLPGSVQCHSARAAHGLPELHLMAQAQRLA